MDIRRVQMTGGSSLVVTLPKEWTTAMRIQKNDPVRVAVQPDGTLSITARVSDDQEQRTKELDVSSCASPSFLFRTLIGCYIAGFSAITVRSKTRLPPFVRTVVRDFTQMTIGQEVTEESETAIRIKDLLNPSELPFENTLKRMFVVVKSMHEDAISAIELGDEALAREVIRQDRDIDRLQWLVARQTNMIMTDPNLSRKMGASSGVASSYAAVARILERIGDHAVRIAKNAIVLADSPVGPDVVARLRTASAFSIGVLDRALASFFTRDMHLANRTIEEMPHAEALAEEVHTAALSLSTAPAVALGYVAESVRRVGEYASDVAETVINHAVERES
ncbi:MAG: phosphate uptake regulator PhoU [Methanospirillum sp.]